MIEAILLVCLSLTTAPDPCVYMNTESRMVHTREQCHFWLEQGMKEIQTREHFEAIRQKLGTIQSPLNEKPDNSFYMKPLCKEHLERQPFKCRDCDT